MKLLFIGPENIFNEFVSTIPANVICKHIHQPVIDHENYEVVVDAWFDTRLELPNQFIYPTTHLFIGAGVKRKLSDSKNLLNQHIASPIIGMNLLPTFIKSKTKEIAGNDEDALEHFKALAMTWQWDFRHVNDEIGLVASRVLAMVINEAAHTLEEKTATKEDIDQGMELGTGYPQGPLKWCDKIGVEHITSVLKALYQSTGDERYRIAPLLLRMQESHETFY